MRKMDLLDTRQLSDLLGMSQQSIRNNAYWGNLPTITIGGRYYFDKESVFDHISNEKQKKYFERKSYQNEESLCLKKENEFLRDKVQQLEIKLASVAEMLK